MVFEDERAATSKGVFGVVALIAVLTMGRLAGLGYEGVSATVTLGRERY